MLHSGRTRKVYSEHLGNLDRETHRIDTRSTGRCLVFSSLKWFSVPALLDTHYNTINTSASVHPLNTRTAQINPYLFISRGMIAIFYKLFTYTLYFFLKSRIRCTLTDVHTLPCWAGPFSTFIISFFWNRKKRCLLQVPNLGPSTISTAAINS